MRSTQSLIQSIYLVIAVAAGGAVVCFYLSTQVTADVGSKAYSAIGAALATFVGVLCGFVFNAKFLEPERLRLLREHETIRNALDAYRALHEAAHKTYRALSQAFLRPVPAERVNDLMGDLDAAVDRLSLVSKADYDDAISLLQAAMNVQGALLHLETMDETVLVHRRRVFAAHLRQVSLTCIARTGALNDHRDDWALDPTVAAIQKAKPNVRDDEPDPPRAREAKVAVPAEEPTGVRVDASAEVPPNALPAEAPADVAANHPAPAEAGVEGTTKT